MPRKAESQKTSNFESLSPAQADLILSLNSLRSRLFVSLPAGESGELYKGRMSKLFDSVRAIAICSPDGGSRKAKACVDLLIVDWTKVDVALDFVNKVAPFSPNMEENEWIGIFARGARCKSSSSTVSPLSVVLSVLRVRGSEASKTDIDSMTRAAARDESALSKEIQRLQSDLMSTPPLNMPIRTDTPAIPTSLTQYHRQMDIQSSRGR